MKKLSLFIVLSGLWILASGFSTLHAQQTPDPPAPLLEGDSGLRFERAATGEKVLHWLGRADRTYFIQASPDLLDWTWAPNIESGLDGLMSYEVDGPVAAGFFRLQYTDQTAEDPDAADFDEDGLSNNFELTPRPRPGGVPIGFNLNPNIQTNPLRADTDGDGLNDKWELEHGFDPTDDGTRNPDNGPSADPDEDGANNLKEYQASTNPKSSAEFPAQIISVFRWATGGGLTATTSSNESVYYNAASWVPAAYSETISNFFSIPELTAMSEIVEFPATPPNSDHYSASDYPQTGIFQTSSSYLRTDSNYAAGIISQSRSWLKAPAKAYPQRKNFIKSSWQQILDAVGTLVSETTSAEVVTLEIPANQILSQPIDIKPVPGIPAAGGRILKTDAIKTLRLVSRDRYLAGAIDTSVLGKGISAEFINTTTGENLGTFSDLERIDGNTKIFSHVTEVLDPDASPGERQPVGQKVWFVREADGLNFYTCFSEVGEIEIRLKAQSTQLVTLHHTLTSAADFSEVIDYVNDWVIGSSFNGGTTPVTTSGPPSTPTGIDYLTSACLIPLFNVVAQVEGLTGVFVGLYEGVKQGVLDDRDFILLVGSSVVEAGSYAVGQAQIELNKFLNDPFRRAQEIKNLTDQFINDILFKTFRTIDRKLSTWDGFKDKSWAVWEAIGQAATLQYTINNTLWNKVVNGLCDWHQDFNNRMAIGSEKVHWGQTLWVKDKLLANVDEIAGGAIRTAGFTIGYSSGYLLEQVCVAIGSEGVYTLAKVAIKGGIQLGANLSLRTAYALGTRSQLLKRCLAEASEPLEMYFNAERGLAESAKTPISAEIKDTAAEVLEQTMRRENFDRNIFNTKILTEELFNCSRLQQLFRIPGMEGRFLKASGNLAKQMGETLTPKAAKNWPKLANSIAPAGESALANDFLREADLFKVFKIDTPKGKQVLNELLESLDGKTATEIIKGVQLPPSIKDLYPTMYHYADRSTLIDYADDLGEGVWKLHSKPGGRHVGFEDLNNPALAQNRFQLPLEKINGSWQPMANKGRFKAVVTTTDDLQVPQCSIHSADSQTGVRPWLELIVKDNPACGGGGAIQCTSETEVVVKVYDALSGALVKDKANLLELLAQ